MLEKFCTWLIRRQKILLPLVLVFALLFPLVIKNDYIMRIAIIALMYSMLAVSLNLMIGILGQMSFGHAAFMGIGAYTTAILAKTFHLGSGLNLIASAVMAGLFGVILGLMVLKLKGYYFTIVTMVFGEIIRIIELNWMSLTRGPLGLIGIPRPSFFGFVLRGQAAYFYMILVLLILAIFIVNNLTNSRIGYAILAVRDDEIAAESNGINVFRTKVITFVVSSMLAGVAGGFFAQYQTYIDPSAFSGLQSNEMLVMTIFGGLGNIFGSIFGAVVLSILPEVLRGFAAYRQIIYGILLVAMMMGRPQGLFGSIRFKYLAQRLSLGRET
jgi:branched-chain amino acid transport system permease protein